MKEKVFCSFSYVRMVVRMIHKVSRKQLVDVTEDNFKGQFGIRILHAIFILKFK